MLSVGQVLQDRYKIIGELGRGGMGAVYSAFDNRLAVSCVVKELLITPEMSDNLVEAALQFHREASTLAGLHHHNLPKVTDYFEENGNYYLVMEFIRGQGLDKLIQTQGIPESTVLTYGDQLLDVLDYIHSNGVLHRDIKPANIIVREDGRVVLVDFGLVKDTRAGLITKSILRGYGTPKYSPPEQYSGGTDQRSDLYALAATLYNALVGHAPPSVTEQVSGEKIQPLHLARRDITANTSRVIMKSLSLEPSLRYANAADMRGALSKTHKDPIKIWPLVVLVAAGLMVVLALSNELSCRGSVPPSPTAEPSSTVFPTTTSPASPTPQSTVTVPPTTVSPTPIPKPSPIPASPTPTFCNIENPYNLSQRQLAKLGCESQGVVNKRAVVYQYYQGGFMVVFDASDGNDFSTKNTALPRRFYVLAENSDHSAWRVYFASSDVPQNGTDQTKWYSCGNVKPKSNGQMPRPLESRIPWRGFGMVWCGHQQIEQVLGLVRALPDQSVSAGNDEIKDYISFQSFGAGRAFQLRGKTYVVYLDLPADGSKDDSYVTGTWEYAGQ